MGDIQCFIVIFQQAHYTGREVAVTSVSCYVRTGWLSPSTSRDLTNLPSTVSVRTARTSFIFVPSPDTGRNVKPDITLTNSSALCSVPVLQFLRFIFVFQSHITSGNIIYI